MLLRSALFNLFADTACAPQINYTLAAIWFSTTQLFSNPVRLGILLFSCFGDLLRWVTGSSWGARVQLHFW
jgi:hypothetical protein